jgi:dihydrofolate synthase/folylpolyglutamate synthase
MYRVVDMKYLETIDYLYGLQKFGMKFGLDNIRRLLSVIDNPERSFRSIHVAGTNGKGSTAAMIESILRTSSATTGLFTSPHIVSFTERIRINGREMPEHDVIAIADDVRSAAEGIEDFSPTFFEVVTAMAFLYFRNSGVDWAVIEVGMGGRLDATNVLVPEAAVITSIGVDHTEFLGETIIKIAEEKTGIMKQNVPVISAAQPNGVADVIMRKAESTNARVVQYDTHFSAEMVSFDPDGMCFNYSGSAEYRNIRLPLAGEYQIINASLAAKTIEVLSEKYPGMNCDIRRGLEEVQWPGRLEMIKRSPPILIDGAHNPSASHALAQSLQRKLDNQYRRIILIIGIMGDKNVEAILAPLLPLSAETIFVSPAYERAASSGLLADAAQSLGYTSRNALSVTDGIHLAEKLYQPGDLIVITGSFYTIGEAKEALFNKGILSRLRE